MVVISETSGGSNGDDPNKKRKEVEKKRKEEEENNRNKKLKEKLSYSLPIPDDLTLSCFALVEICHYQKLSLVCSNFRDIIRSRDLYVKRSNLGLTESVLYAYIRLIPLEKPSWYVLQRVPYRNLPNTLSWRLTLIDSIPPMPFEAAIVTNGSDIYVIGGLVGGRPTSSMILMDCKSCRCRLLPRMRMSRFRAGAGVIDGKIYVIGGCSMQLCNWIEVFDIKEQTWTGLEFPYLPDMYKEFVKYAVMEKNIYLMDGGVLCCALDPINMRWFHQGQELDHLRSVWHMSYCVIDDLLVCINPMMEVVGGPIALYDRKQKLLRHVNGLQGFPGNMNLRESRMENFDGNLVILGSDQSWFSEYKGKKEIWCVEISFELRERGEIWGIIESAAVVLTTYNNTPSIQLCRTVTL
ncbi:PREDICTED: putative F-box/kelch-repeat protein At2g21680 [Camelina sativa]|uniref:F-box/kelch-repeat protein At2g21680 n=1 Tax=Camelina sativa TaxID=90675 RepID=A0ABM0TUB2_CAMSA|nr:PREDICTED: putative F-box/kelch-repeat protein At2g21680 [Camelina sativa]